MCSYQLVSPDQFPCPLLQVTRVELPVPDTGLCHVIALNLPRCCCFGVRRQRGRHIGRGYMGMPI